MLLEAELPNQYWTEAAMTATYLQNRLATTANRETPFKMWHVHKTSVEHLRVFG